MREAQAQGNMLPLVMRYGETPADNLSPVNRRLARPGGPAPLSMASYGNRNALAGPLGDLQTSTLPERPFPRQRDPQPPYGDEGGYWVIDPETGARHWVKLPKMELYIDPDHSRGFGLSGRDVDPYFGDPDGMRRVGHGKMATLVPLVHDAVKSGGNETLQYLLMLARNDPHMSSVMPDDLAMEATGPGEMTVSGAFGRDHLWNLSKTAESPELLRQMADAQPGRYTYTLKDDRVTGFEPAAPPWSGRASNT